MDEEAALIMSQSRRRLTRLKLLSNFFENVDIISIHIKTDIIHNLFEENNLLDYHKLELFHLQYTDSLIELLTKIKKKKENDLLAVINEININNQYIVSFKERKSDNFELERKFYNGIFSRHIKTLYQDLIENKFSLDWNDVLYFSKKYTTEFYKTEAEEDKLKSTVSNLYYQYKDYSIERKLLGKLNIENFKVRFVCGYHINNNVYELFRITRSDEYFVFNIEKKEMYLINDELSYLDTSPNESNQASIINQLKRKNEELEGNMDTEKRTLPKEVEDVLKDYLKNLENIDVMSKIFDVNEETNILKAMLNLNLNN